MGQMKLRLHSDTENEFTITGFNLNFVKAVLYGIFTALTLGMGALPLYWRTDWLIIVLFSPCYSLLDASDILIRDLYGRYFRRRLFKMEITSDDLWNFLMTKISSESEIYLKRDEKLMLGQNGNKNQGTAYFTSVDCDSSSSFMLDAKNRQLLCFSYEKTTYIISSDGLSACKFPSLATKLKPQDAASNIKKGLSVDEVEKRRRVYGSNVIDINPKSIPTLLVQECLHFFYFFQLFSVTIWIIDDYLYYSLCIIFLSVFSIVWSLYMTYTQQRKIIKMTKIEDVIPVLRNGLLDNCWQKDLVPGDIVVIPRSGCQLTFDAVLLTGSAIVNESMLTGESVPVTKTPYSAVPEYENTVYSAKHHMKHTLCSGTHVLQARTYSNDECYAFVVNTGFYTRKGELIRSILYPKPMSFRLFFDAIMFVLFLMCVAMMGFVYTIVIMTKRGDEWFDIAKRALDIITVAVPPALPAALNIGIVYAQNRLRKSKIFCISPRRIDVAGSIDTVCFDKTGTLTEDDMTFKYVVTVDDSTNVLNDEIAELKTVPIDSPLVVGLSTCHTLTRIDEKLIGDPMDLKLFECCDWTFHECGSGEGFDYGSLSPSIVISPKFNDGDSLEVGIIRQFPFSSEMQRMAVIVRDTRKDHFDFFVKGSPERLAKMCKKLPSNYKQSLEHYTNNGFRVLALAHKPLDSKLVWHKIHKIPLSSLECDLEFLGFLVFCNKLKKASTPTIKKLHYAGLRTVMVTGDNIATAVAVARDCGLLPKNQKLRMFYHPEDVLYFCSKPTPTKSVFALTGDAFTALQQISDIEILKSFVCNTYVFSRMTPEQKSHLVEFFQSFGFYVAMCGDGANDCGALKLAHVGISLSELEASAASPFTSSTPDISCVDKLIREGRASLVNSFSTFKFMGLYSMIQFSSIVLLYWYHSTLGDNQFLYVDLWIIILLILTMGETEASPKLSKYKPPVRLFNAIVFITLTTSILLQFLVQLSSLIVLGRYDWYKNNQNEGNGEEEIIICPENTTILNVSSFLYIFSALGVSPGSPHRKPFYTNIRYLAVLIVLIVSQLVVTFHQSNWPLIPQVMELVYLPSLLFKLQLVTICVMYLLVLFILEFKVFANKDRVDVVPSIIRTLFHRLSWRRHEKDTVAANASFVADNSVERYGKGDQWDYSQVSPNHNPASPGYIAYAGNKRNSFDDIIVISTL